MRRCSGGTYVLPSTPCPNDNSPPPSSPSSRSSQPPTQSPTQPPPSSQPVLPTPFFNPADIDGGNFNPCANGGCPRETEPIPETRVCTTDWSTTTRREMLSRLRWESIVPYSSGFTGHHHPEAPGGRLFLTTASTAGNPARHWTALQPGTTLDVLDAPADGCLWTATAVGVSFRELLAYESSDLAKLRSPGSSAAAGPAQQAAELWDRLSPERKRWYQVAFPRTDPRLSGALLLICPLGPCRPTKCCPCPPPGRAATDDAVGQFPAVASGSGSSRSGTPLSWMISTPRSWPPICPGSVNRPGIWANR